MIHTHKESSHFRVSTPSSPKSPHRRLLTSYFSVIFRCRARFQRCLAQPESGSKIKTHKAAVKIFLQKIISDSILESIFPNERSNKELSFPGSRRFRVLARREGDGEGGRMRADRWGEPLSAAQLLGREREKKKKEKKRAHEQKPGAAVELLYAKLDRVLRSHVHTKHMLSLNDRWEDYLERLFLDLCSQHLASSESPIQSQSVGSDDSCRRGK